MKNILNKKLNKKGFTLAELLIVVAIIAILVAIALPLFFGALDNAKEQTFNANMRSLKAAGVSKILEDGPDNIDGTGEVYEIKGKVDVNGNITDVSIKRVGKEGDPTEWDDVHEYYTKGEEVWTVYAENVKYAAAGD